MFQLIDGREYLWQWDINRQVKVEDPAIDEVHFCNRTSDCSLVVEVKDGVADIPNILLQQDFPIKVYAYLKDGYTKVEECLKVKSRTKPSDYIYTETEVITVQTVEQRMTELEERVDLKIDDVERTFEENLEDAVNDYLNSRPNIASVQYVDERIADHKHDVADIKQFTENVQLIVKNMGLATDEELRIVTEDICEFIDDLYVKVGDIDERGYATEDYVDTAIDNIDLTGYADKVHFHTSYEVSDFTTRTNSLINEALKDVKVDLTGYATEEYVDDAVYNSKDAYYLNFSSATSEEQPATAEMIEFATRFDDNQNVCAHIKGREMFGLLGWNVATINGNSTKGLSFIQSGIDPRAITEGEEHNYCRYVVKKKAENDWVYYIATTYKVGFATQEYVDNAIANLDIPESDLTIALTDDGEGNVSIQAISKRAEGGSY